MTRISTFCSSRWVAKLCRSVCIETRLSMRAASRGLMHGAVELPRAQGVHRVQTREQPAAGEHLALGTGDAPPGAQPLEQHRREHGVAILAALALLDAQRHALAIDVADLQRDDFAGAKSRAVGDRQGRLMLEVLGRGDQATRPPRGSTRPAMCAARAPAASWPSARAIER